MRSMTGIMIATIFGIGVSPDASADQAQTNPSYVIYPDLSLIQRGLSPLPRVLRRNYDKYISYRTPNGGSVPLVATDDVSDEQLLRAYNILDFYLTDVPGSQYGSDKSAVANAMAANGAVLVMPGGSDGDSTVWPWALAGQPLYQLEFPVEGSPAYLSNDYQQRDAGFEEIFHMVHDYGIGTKLSDGALKDSYQVELAEATNSAFDEGRWAATPDAGTKEWIEELRAEGSLQQEYIASVIDSFYGLWGPWDEGPGGMWGIYIGKTRAEVERLDPLGAAVLQKFLPDQITYMARIDPSFEGTFEMSFNADQPYTHKSQYLLNARLLGDLPSSLLGNAHDNVIMGNGANNTLDGADGFDVVQYGFASGQAIISNVDGIVTVDSETGGRDTLRNIEAIRFTDKDIRLNQY